MKKKYFSILLPLLLFSVYCFSQKETEKWYYAGSPAPALDFSGGGNPVVLNNSGITFSWEGGGSLSDANGNLLFYGDGNSICFNRNHVAMTNGTGLIMHNSVTQSPIFVPKPGNPNVYYMFYIGKPSLGSPPFNFYYSEIDMTLGGGFGAITANKNIALAPNMNNCAEKMTVTKHCNGTDYWVMVHSYTGSNFYAYLVTAAGVNTVPVITNIGANYLTQVPATNEDAVGQMKFTPNGTKLGVMVAGQKIVELYDFNKTTGVISNRINLGNAGSDFPYGLEFSPDNSKIYACGSSNTLPTSLLKQWDLCAGNAAAIIASGTTIASGVSASSLQMAPNGKIYGCKFSNFLLAINNPNVAGLGCGYVANAVNTAPGGNQLGLPNFITSYFYNPNLNPNITVVPVNTTNCQNNGSATASLCQVFGTAPYTYTWSNNTVDGPTANVTSSISNLAPGSYNVIVTDATCMVDTINFTITGVIPTPLTQNVSLCNGSSYTLPGGGTATVSGTYNDTLLGSNGCDSIIITNLTISTSINVSTNDTICSGGSYTLPGGGIVNTSGAYNDTLPASGGCDSIITTNLVVSPALTGALNPSICAGNSYTLPGGGIATATGTYIDTLATTSGCDSIVTTNLTVNPALTGNQNPQICIGGSFTLPGGTVVNTAGTYFDTLTTTSGCDSIVTTVLAITPNIQITQTPVICAGNTFTLPDGSIVNTAGTWVDTVTAIGGCDSIITTNLSITPPVSVSQNQTICAGNNYTLPGGTIVSTPGTYIDTINTTAGCDSIVTTSLAVLPNSTSSQNPTICSNESYTLPDGTIVNTSGTYTSTIASANGCDSVITTTLNVNPSPTAVVSADVTIIMGNSTPLTASGGGTYSWSPTTGLDNSSSASVVATPTVTTTYCVIITSANGCVDSACVTVYVEIPCPKEENLGIPNAFSPNNDGLNDEFCLQGWENCMEDFSISIYSRWGDKVFESSKPDFCWDGVYKGNIMDAQVFVYYMKAKYKNIPTVINSTGNISLIK